jgi:hypothetical protein
LVGKSCAADVIGKAVADKAKQNAAIRPQVPCQFEPNNKFMLSISFFVE